MLYHPAYDARGDVWWMVVLRMLSSPGDTILTPLGVRQPSIHQCCSENDDTVGNSSIVY